MRLPEHPEPSDRPRRCLVLLSDTGGGHRAAAEALAQAFDQLQPGAWDLRLVDALRGALWPVSGFPRQYAFIARRLPRLWGLGFRLSDGRRRAAGCEQPVAWALRRSLRRLMGEAAPDLVVSVHPFLTQPAIRALRRLRPGTPFATVVTDLVDGHALWYRGRPDALVVPTRAAAARALALGADPARLHALGQPIALAYLDRPPTPAEGRRRLGLDPELPLLLLSAGGDGVGPLEALTQRLAELPGRPQVVVACGRNEALRRRLAARWAQEPRLRILGFTREMPAYLHAADLVLSKAGPSTVMETLAAGRPMVLHGFLPGQERGNVAWLEERGVGFLRPEPAAAAALVQAWLAEGPAALAARQARARAVARPAAALDIVGRLLDLVDEG